MTSHVGWWLDRQHVGPMPSQQSSLTCVDRMVEHFSCLKQDEYLVEGEMGIQIPPFVAKFSKDLLNGNMLGVADEDGRVRLFDTRKSKSCSVIKEWSAHSNAVFDLAWIENQSKMATASGDQTGRLWDIEKCETIGNFRGHTRSLKSIDVQPGSGFVLLTSARDGDMMLWDTRCNLRNSYHIPVNTIPHAHERSPNDVTTPASQKKKRGRRPTTQGDTKQSVTSALFLNDDQIVSSGACDGTLKYWDIRKNYNRKKDNSPLHVINFRGNGPRKHGFSSLVLNSTRSRVFAVCTNNIIYEFSTTNFASTPHATYQGHLASSFYVKAAISPDDRYLLCGSSDNAAYIWRTDDANGLPWVMGGHEGEVMSVAWSPHDGRKIVTTSDDNTVKLWRLFQNTSDPNQVSGLVQRKRPEQDPTSTEQTSGDVVLQNGVPDMDIPEKKENCYCKRFTYISNRKVRMKWKRNIVLHAKDTIPSVSSVCSKTRPGSSPGTTLTPKNDKCPTPSQPLSGKLNTSSGQVNKSGGARSQATPLSSRRSMKSWLKSPGVAETPGKGRKHSSSDVPVSASKNIVCSKLQTPGPNSSKLHLTTPNESCSSVQSTPGARSKQRTSSLLESTPLTSSKRLEHMCSASAMNDSTPVSSTRLGSDTPLTSSETASKPNTLRNQNKKFVKHLSYDNMDANASPDTSLDVDSSPLPNRKSKPVSAVKSKKSAAKNPKKGNGKSKTHGCGNIKDMFLSMKHKADSACEEMDDNRKRAKLDEESVHDTEDVALEVLETSDLMDKENIFPTPSDSSKEILTTRDSLVVSADDVETKAPTDYIKDVLDIAEESMNC